MSGFPVSLTSPTPEEQKRIDEMTGQVDRAYGRGAFTEATDSVFKRQNRFVGTVLAGISMAISAVIKNIMPQTSTPEDLLSTHERWYRLQPDKSLTTQQRQARLLAHTQKRPDARLWKIANELEKVVGVGNVTPAQNTAAGLDLLGYSRSGMFVIAYGVPVAFIKTIGQIDVLDRIIAAWKPITVQGHCARTLGTGFLTDHDASLTDRDVLED